MHNMRSQVMNKAVAWTSLWGMLITYLPGTLISCTQLVTRKPQLRQWGWFKVRVFSLLLGKHAPQVAFRECLEQAIACGAALGRWH